MRHLLSIADLERADIERILERAESFAEVGRRDIKKVPTLRGRTVVSLFYESSTRTSSSFELAAKRLSADVVSVKSSGSSVDKGESLKDTIATLSAYGPEAIIIRHPHAGAANLVSRLDGRRGGQRRRRQARAPEPGAARHLHAPRPLRPLGGARAPTSRASGSGSSATSCTAASRARACSAFTHDGRRGDGLRAADADPARDRGRARAATSPTTSTTSARPTSSTRCGCSASG